MNIFSLQTDTNYKKRFATKNKQLNIQKLGLYRNYQLTFQHFCQNGTLHGFNYVASTSISRTERMFWTTICLLCILACIFLSFSFAQGWYSSPFNIVLDDNYTPVFDIPFPSMIICPNSPVKKSALDAKNISDEYVAFIVSQVCSNMTYTNPPLENRLPFEFDRNMLDFITQNAPTCEETLKLCSWAQEFYDEPATFDCCSELFQPVFTNKGLCFGFNMLSRLSKEKYDAIESDFSINLWDVHSGYKYMNVGLSGSKTLNYPRAAYDSGEGYGLKVELYMNTSETQQYCDGLRYGFQVLINNPINSPLSNNYFPISMEKVTSFAVIPDKITTRGDMRNWKYSDRKCYFENEMKLQYFSFYTKDNCVAECEMKQVIAACKCVPFYVKSLLPKMPLCSSADDIVCSQNVIRAMKKDAIDRYFKFKGFDNDDNVTSLINDSYVNGIKMKACICLQACDDINYNLEVTFTDLPYSNLLPLPPWAKTPTKRHEVTRIAMFYKEPTFIGKNRQMRYTLLDFIGSCGGILSLFIGFSIISLVELGVLFIKPLISFIMNCSIFRRNIHGPVYPYKE